MENNLKILQDISRQIKNDYNDPRIFENCQSHPVLDEDRLARVRVISLLLELNRIERAAVG